MQKPAENPIDQILETPLFMIPIALGTAVGAFVSIAGGFWVTFKLVVLIGAT